MQPNDPFANQSERRGARLRLRARIFSALYRVAWLVLILLLVNAVISQTLWGFLAVPLITGLLIAFALLRTQALKLTKTAERHLVTSASGVVEVAQPHLLYLRSFTSEPATRRVSFFSQKTFEEEHFLMDALCDIGPLVAIGHPGDALPQLGASRLYVADSDWREVVTRMMQDATAVVIRIGLGGGLDWEVWQALQLLRPEQLLFVIPSDHAAYDLFKCRYDPVLPRPLPFLPPPLVFESQNRPAGLDLLGFLRFNSDWAGTFDFFNFVLPSRGSVRKQFRRCAAPFVHSVTTMQQNARSRARNNLASYRFNPPPDWPVPPVGWSPAPGWRPDPSWPLPPSGWRLWISRDADI